MKKIFPLFAVIIVLVLAVCSFHIIPTGYTGVKTSFGQIKETTIQSGKLNFCIPFVQSISKRVARMAKTEMGIHCYQKKRRWYWSAVRFSSFSARYFSI